MQKVFAVRDAPARPSYRDGRILPVLCAAEAYNKPGSHFWTAHYIVMKTMAWSPIARSRAASRASCGSWIRQRSRSRATMFRSLGNILVNPAVGLLFVDFERPWRVRVNGTATLHDDDPLLAEFAGAQLVLRVRATRIFPNCPRSTSTMGVEAPSPYARARGCTPPLPE